MPDLNQLTGQTSLSSSVNLSQPIDYTFTIGARSPFSAVLRGFGENVDVQLRSAASGLIAESVNGYGMPDTINQDLDAGTYTLTVKTTSTRNVSYSLALNGGTSKNLIWRNNETDQSVLWDLRGTDLAEGSLLGNLPVLGKQNDWKILGTGDFNGDGESDYLWRNQKADQTVIWYIKNGAFDSGAFLTAPSIGSNSDWNIVGVADFSGDGQADLLWRNQKADQTVFWTIKNGAYESGAFLGNSPSIGGNSDWNIVGVGDFDGDEQNDFLWRHEQADQTVVWTIKNGAFVSGEFINAPAIGANSSWKIQGASDFNGDKQADILWRNSDSGAIVVWYVKDKQYQSGLFLGNAPNVADQNWEIVGIGQQPVSSLTTGGVNLQSALNIGSLLGGDIYGTVNYTDALKAGQSAFYKFTLNSSTPLESTFTPIAGTSSIQFLDSDGNPIAVGAIGYGTYFAKVTNTGNIDGRYKLSLSHFPLRQFGTTGIDQANSVAVDSSGNVYITGYTEGAFNGYTNPSGTDCFVTKYDRNGNQVWIKQFGSTLGYVGTSIKVDGNDNIYVAGSNQVAIGQLDGFLARYDSNGNQSWFRQFGTASADMVSDIAIDNNGNIYLTGFTDSDFMGAATSSADGFITRYSNDGQQIWFKQFGTTALDQANGITVDNSGSIYITGFTNGSFNGYTNQGLTDGFIAKYDINGNQTWLKQIGGNFDERFEKVKLDSSGNLYITSFSSRNIDTSSIAKYDSNGNTVWSNVFGGVRLRDVVIDRSNQVYAIGHTIGSPKNYGFINRYDVNGSQNLSPSSLQFGADRNVTAFGGAVNAEGEVYVVGSTDGTFINNTSSGGSNAFLYGFKFL